MHKVIRTHSLAGSVLSVVIGIAAVWSVSVAALVGLDNSGLRWLRRLGGLGGLGGLSVGLRVCNRSSKGTSCNECYKSEVLAEMHVVCGWR